MLDTTSDLLGLWHGDPIFTSPLPHVLLLDSCENLWQSTSLPVPRSIWVTPHLCPGASPLQVQPVYHLLCSFWILVFIMLRF